MTLKKLHLFISFTFIAMVPGCRHAGGQVTVTPAPTVLVQYFNGAVPCNGCLLYTYAAGTTTPLLSYTDSTGATPNADPVVLDSTGYASVWLGPSSYKLVLKTAAGVTIRSQDGIKGNFVAPAFTGPATITDTTASDIALLVTNSGNSSIGIKVSDSGTNSTPLDLTNAGTGKIATLKNSGATEVLGVTQTGIQINSGTTITAQSGTGGTLCMSAACVPNFGNTTVSGTIHATGAAALDNTLTVGNVTALNSLGTNTVAGNLTLGDNSSGPSVANLEVWQTSHVHKASTLDTYFALTRGAINLVNGANNNIDLTGGASSVSSFVKISGPSAVFNVSGFTNGINGQVLYLYNSVAFAMTITNEGAASTAANRITTLTGADVVLRAGTSFSTFIYDSAASRWILVTTN